MHRMLVTILAQFFELQTLLQLLLIFRRVIISLLTHRALEFNEIVLGHMS